MNRRRILSILVLVLSVFVSCKQVDKKEQKQLVKKDSISKVDAKIYSYPKSEFIIFQDTVRKDDTFGKILNRQNLPLSSIFELLQAIKDSFDVKYIKVGKPYTILSKKDSLDSLPRPKVFIYENDPVHYTVVDFQDRIKVKHKEKPVRYVRKEASVQIIKSMYQDIADKDLSPKLAMELSDIYAWTVDFFHLNKGDSFRVIYDDVYINDTIYTGIGTIYAALFNYGGKDFYAFRYPADTTGMRYGYFDDKGRTMRKQFLKSPLKFGRITSRYNLRRFIRLYGRVKPHLGTDFAAPTGTPIMATANGTVIKKGYTSGNGNYIKIKHNATYSTQYLHMSRFAKGIHVGSVVAQGDVIGYVGSTGHATGPHVCYRFWKHGKQVDALKEKLPPAKPIDSTMLQGYLEYIKPLKQQLDSIK